MATLSVINVKGEKVEAMDLPDTIFGVPVNMNILHQAIVMYQANLRQGTASTKERGAVSGGGKKPWRQKGTGRARAGSIRSPLWHGGGVIFGPHPRDFSYSVPRQIRTSALRESLNDKFSSNNLICVDELKIPSQKTKDFAKILSKLKLKGRVLTLLDQSDEATVKACRNIPHLSLMRSMDVNAYDILRNQKVLVTKGAFKNLLKRLK